MKYKYTGDGPFPLFVYGVGVVTEDKREIESDEPINHKHFELVKPKKSEGAE